MFFACLHRVAGGLRIVVVNSLGALDSDNSSSSSEPINTCVLFTRTKPQRRNANAGICRALTLTLSSQLPGSFPASATRLALEYTNRMVTPCTRTLALIALAIGGLSPAAQASNIDPIYAFGDSLSDVGNIYAASGGVIPGPPYVNGQFSNGPVWVQDLASSLGLAPPRPACWVAATTPTALPKPAQRRSMQPIRRI